MPCLHEVCTAFFVFKAFQPLLVTYLATVVLKTLILLSWSFSYLSVFLNYYPYTYSFFDNISHTVYKKTGHLPLGVSLVCLLTSLFFWPPVHSSFRRLNNLAISLTKWPEYPKNRRLSCSTNSVRLHFRERVEKIKENGKNTKIENLQNRQEKYGCNKTRVRAHLGQKWKKKIFLHILVWICFERVSRKTAYLNQFTFV